MFRRRQPLTFFRSVRGFLWPRTGWRRAFVYYLKRLSRLSGTLVGNPWTFPFIWLASYELGKLVLGPDLAGAHPMPGRLQDLAGYVGTAAGQATADGSVAMLKRLWADLSAIAKPVLVGGVPLGILAGLLTYFPLVRAIAAYQEARRRRREQRRGEERRRRAAGAQLNTAGAPTDAGTA